LRYPTVEIVGGPCVLIIVAVIRSSCLSFDYAHDIIFALFIELFLLGVTDNIIRRSNTSAHIANYCPIKPKRFERLNLHILVSYPTSVSIHLFKIVKIAKAENNTKEWGNCQIRTRYFKEVDAVG